MTALDYMVLVLLLTAFIFAILEGAVLAPVTIGAIVGLIISMKVEV